MALQEDLDAACRKKERAYQELSGDGGRARLVVLAAEVGVTMVERNGAVPECFGGGTVTVSPLILQGRAKAAWLRRWSAMLACSAARAFAVSLLDRRNVPGVGGDHPSVHEVLREDRFWWYFLL